MFSTLPSFAHPAGFMGEPEEQFWSIVELGTSAPWFVFHYLVQDGDQTVGRTLLVSGCPTLLDVLKEVECPRSLCVMNADRATPGGWLCSPIEEVWLAEGSKTELQFRLFGQPGLVNDCLQPLVASTQGDHHLLTKFPG